VTKDITINAPEDLSIDKLMIEQTISQPADLEVGPVKVGDSSVLSWSNIPVLLLIFGFVILLKKM